ncbi:hypothetical protein Msil_3362 [Methylocella silvestris BL2]|uniref:Uncharacterized protein n=1 Tax=Methylocella silvestris (strain DSM 15510 / CIP 108128 / LMG 27833 / NCIMB 13906 / BL2) TaxID=395965 RepID=B8ES52_METSB|nr:hypothetical protein Msil_3362 [Methylocella silvestris BL2]
MILVQVSAIVLHTIRKETAKAVWPNLILVAAPAFVVRERW